MNKKKRLKPTKCLIDISRILFFPIVIRCVIFLLFCDICDQQQLHL